MISEESLQALTERLELLEEERSILRTMYDYAHCIDYGRYDDFLDLFTEDTLRTSQRRDGQYIFRMEGRDALAANPHTRAPFNYHKHLMFNPMITMISKTEARVESYSLRLDEHNDKPVIVSFGRYFDLLVKQDGKWRFKERKSQMEYTINGDHKPQMNVYASAAVGLPNARGWGSPAKE